MSDSNKDINAELLEAVRIGNIHTVRRLISEGADVDKYDESQGNPLYWAVKSNHSNIAKVLLDNGATFFAYDSSQERHVHDKFQSIKDEHCKNSLHLAARLGKLEAVKDLLGKGANVNAKNDTGETPLHIAATYNHTKEVVEALLGKKETNVNAQDNSKKTPLHLAAQNNNEEIVVALIKAGADVSITDKDGNTPFNLATDEKIKTLLQPTEKTDPVDESPTESKGG